MLNNYLILWKSLMDRIGKSYLSSLLNSLRIRYYLTNENFYLYKLKLYELVT